MCRSALTLNIKSWAHTTIPNSQHSPPHPTHTYPNRSYGSISIGSKRHRGGNVLRTQILLSKIQNKVKPLLWTGMTPANISRKVIRGEIPKLEIKRREG